jgi:hypothetical protein
MVDIAEEFVEFARKRGFEFSPNSRSALDGDFPRLQVLERLSEAERASLYDMILAEVPTVQGIRPTELHERDIPDAAKRLSQGFALRGVPFSSSAENVIRDCCPYC